MKKILFALVIVLTMSFGASAQHDNFFNDWDDVSNGLDRDPDLGFGLPGLPGSHGDTNDVAAPLGSGLLVLTALGAGYALRNKRD